MAETFSFKLVTPVGIIVDEPVEEVIGVSALGEFGVLPNHINFITSLIPGVLRVKKSGQDYTNFVVTGGLAAVKEGEMTVLAPEVQIPAELNREEIATEVKSAQERLAAISYFEAGYAEAERELQLAQARQHATGTGRASH